MNKIIVLYLVTLLSACGFQPLYAKKQATDTNVIQQVQIYKIDNDRNGQILYNSLNNIMNPYGNPRKAPYNLSATVSTSTSSLGVQSDDSTTRQNSTVTVEFVLSNPNNAIEFTISRTTGYNESDNAYATNVARNDAIERNLEEIAQDAKIRIASLIKLQEN